MDFVANVSHELKTPITVAQIHVQRLRRQIRFGRIDPERAGVPHRIRGRRAQGEHAGAVAVGPCRPPRATGVGGERGAGADAMRGVSGVHGGPHR